MKAQLRVEVLEDRTVPSALALGGGHAAVSYDNDPFDHTKPALIVPGPVQVLAPPHATTGLSAATQ